MAVVEVSFGSSSGKSSPVMVLCNSARSILPSPSASIVSIRRSTCEGGKSARLRLNNPDFNSLESIWPSPSLSNLLKRIGIVMPVVANQFRSTSTTSSAMKTVPQWVHLVESNGTRPPQAPHSPRASSETPEKEILHSGHLVESRGITALQAPHSPVATSSVLSSDIGTPILPTTTTDIMIHSLSTVTHTNGGFKHEWRDE